MSIESILKRHKGKKNKEVNTKRVSYLKKARHRNYSATFSTGKSDTVHVSPFFRLQLSFHLILPPGFRKLGPNLTNLTRVTKEKITK